MKIRKKLTNDKKSIFLGIGLWSQI